MNRKGMPTRKRKISAARIINLVRKRKSCIFTGVNLFTVKDAYIIFTFNF
jgi:hypothetical protein